ncbi:hypothetical protein [Streptomyces sp. NPDC058622]|uniref:hypothetical protein n=1 Tax=Streptomyces sp. NPDC058622 TaxID=3346562 RepID=UPI0036625526
MTYSPRPRWMYRTSVGTAMACGLAIGLATPASAGPARLTSVQLDAPDVTVSFRDTDPEDASHTLVLRPQGPGETRRVAVAGEVPGVNRTVVKTVNAGIRADLAYCAVIETRTKPGEGIAGKFSVIEISNEVCSKGAGSADAPSDVSIGSVTGEANPAAGTNRNYWISYRNAGADAKDVTVTVQTSGSVTMRRAPESGTFNGMQCAAAGTGFRCTGGTLAKGASGQVPLLATVKSAGPGAIHATITATGDPNTGNNAQTLGILAVPPKS